MLLPALRPPRTPSWAPQDETVPLAGLAHAQSWPLTWLGGHVPPTGWSF